MEELGRKRFAMSSVIETGPDLRAMLPNCGLDCRRADADLGRDAPLRTASGNQGENLVLEIYGHSIRDARYCHPCRGRSLTP